MDGTFYVTHAVGKRWIADGHRDSVVSISVTWATPSDMSKSSIHAMTMSLATEWGRYGIRLAWQDHRKKHHTQADWQFTTGDARVRLKRLYPSF